MDIEQEQVNQTPDLITTNIENHDTPPPLVPVVSDNKSYDDSICIPQVSKRELLVNYGPTAIPITPEPPPQQSSEKSPEGAHLEESPEGTAPGRPI